MSSYFVKYCAKEFNILHGCPTIRLNTFESLRDEELQQGIQDKSEAIAHSQSRKPGGTAPMVKTDLYINNSYVFCLSEFDSEEEINTDLFIDSGYDSFWVVRDLHGLILQIHTLLQNQITLNWLDYNHIRNMPFRASSSLKIAVFRHARVNYIDDPIGKHIVTGTLGKITEDLEKFLTDAIFTKSKDEFESQREYRIVFMVTCTLPNGSLKIVPVKKEPIDLFLSPLGNLAHDSKLKAFGLSETAIAAHKDMVAKKEQIVSAE